MEALTIHNMRKFKHLKIGAISDSLVIMGASGSGKTTILWSIVLFCRGYNICCNSKLSEHVIREEGVAIETSDFSKLLNYSPLNSMGFGHFAHFGTRNPIDIFATIRSTEFCCSFKVNGKVTLSPYSDAKQQEKIGFAFMGVDSSWTSTTDEPNTLSGILTSSASNMRGQFMELAPQHQQLIEDHLKELFKVSLSYNFEFELAVYVDEGKGKVEIACAGSALRKIFASMVLLFVLIGGKREPKIYLFEEPEAQLHPDLQMSFLSKFYDLAKQYDVQLIITTNSQQTKNLFTPDVTSLCRQLF